MAQVEEVERLLNLVDELKNVNNKIDGNPFDDVIKWLYDRIKELLDNGIKGVKSVVGDIKDAITERIDTIKSGITSTITTVETRIKQNLATLNAGLTNTIHGVESNVKTYINQTLNGIGDVIANAINGIKSAIGGIVDAIRSVARDIGSTIANALGSVISSMTNEIKRVINSLTAYFEDLANAIYAGIASFGDSVITTLNNIIGGVKNWLDGVLKSIKDTLVNVYNNIKDTITNVYNSVKEWITDIYNTISTTISQTIDNVSIWITNIVEQIKRLYEDVRKFIVERGIEFLYWVNENVMPIFNRAVDTSQMLYKIGEQVLETALSGDYEKMKTIFDVGGKSLANELSNSPLGAVVYSIMLFYFNLQLRFIPAQYIAQKQAIINAGLEAPPLDLMIRAYQMGEASLEDVINTLKMNGVNKDNAIKALKGVRNLPPAGWIQEAYLRRLITEEEHDNYLKSHGFNDEDIKIFKFLYYGLPPVSDLIRMAVREAFSPDVAERFGQYDDYPDEFDRFAKQVGLSSEWARAYWASHWDLPSPTMGFDMFHRGIIDEDTLKLLLRALDIMPFWRDKLIQLSYNPLTRVDVRRMYQLGVLTEDDVYKSYLDLGYNPENARRLTEFTKRYSAPEDESELSEIKRLARSTYSSAYRKRVISKDEYKEYLTTLGYVSDDAELLIAIDDTYIASQNDLFDEQDFNKGYKDLVVKAYKNGVINADDVRIILSDLGYTDLEVTLQIQLLDTEYQFYIKSLVADKIGELFVTYTIDEQSAYNYLNVFGFSTFEIERYMTEWQINRNLRTRKPPLSDIVRFLRAGLITMDEFKDELRGLGYNERYISKYVSIYGG
jgi:gas vesicle protein